MNIQCFVAYIFVPLWINSDSPDNYRGLRTLSGYPVVPDLSESLDLKESVFEPLTKRH